MADTPVDQIIAWLRANANAERRPDARAAFIEAHNAALAIKLGARPAVEVPAIETLPKEG